jgi:predicted nucleotidyltransferase component of viral defense system
VNGAVRNADDLRDIAEHFGKPLTEIEQDFLLVMIAGKLQEDFPDMLCFKGGFVLHHVYGTERLSFDVDSTRTAPARHKLDADDVERSIRAAGRPLYKISSTAPATNSKNSLDFDAIKYVGPISRGKVEVEISYREAVCLEPLSMPIGPPYIEQLFVPTMAPPEMLAEKYRTLFQRSRPTDLLDAADLWHGVAGTITADSVADLIPNKFADGIVRRGNHAAGIRDNVEAMEANYETTIRGRAPNAMTYERASHLVLSRLAAVFRK